MVYMGFDKLKGKLAKKGVENPGGLARTIGEKKYGKEKFAKAAKEGKNMKDETPLKKGTKPKKGVAPSKKATPKAKGVVKAKPKKLQTVPQQTPPSLPPQLPMGMFGG